MWNGRGGTVTLEEATKVTNPSRRPTFGAFLRSEPTLFPQGQDEYYAAAAAAAPDNNNHRISNASTAASPLHYYVGSPSGGYSTSSPGPYLMSPLNHPSPFAKSPWIMPSPLLGGFPGNSGLVGSLVRKEGHVYSLAATGDLLYTGSDSKNIRVWKNFREFSGFKSNSGLVKAIVISGDRVFTGHQDGKIRVWKKPSKDNHHLNYLAHKRIGSLPTLKDYIKSSINPKSYVEVRRHSKALRIKHFDAVSCLSLNEEAGILYSGSWDKTMKVWRLSDSKHLESVDAHDDAINAIASGFDGLVFTGSADGTVKVWRRELHGKGTRHFLIRVLLDQESAVTSLVVGEAGVVYSGSSDGTVNFWTRNKHLCHGGTLRGHKLAVLCLAAAGNLVLSGSADKRISVWRRDPVTGAHSWLSVLTGHGGPIKCLAVEQERTPGSSATATSDDDGDENDQRWIVYSGSLDKSVRIWSVSEQTPEMRPYSSPWRSPERLGKQL